MAAYIESIISVIVIATLIRLVVLVQYMAVIVTVIRIPRRFHRFMLPFVVAIAVAIDIAIAVGRVMVIGSGLSVNQRWNQRRLLKIRMLQILIMRRLRWQSQTVKLNLSSRRLLWL